MMITTAILGIPVSTLGKEDTIKAIHELVKNYSESGSICATLNMDFLSNCFRLESKTQKSRSIQFIEKC